MNSPVLTQHSPWIEFYYRSLNRLDDDSASAPSNASGSVLGLADAAAAHPEPRLVLFYNESTILDLVRQLQVCACVLCACACSCL